MHLRDLTQYLTELSQTNNRPWFIMNKPRYDILREEHEDGPRFHIQERYDDAAAVKAHSATDHYLAFRAQVGPWLVAPPEVVRLSDVDVVTQD